MEKTKRVWIEKEGKLLMANKNSARSFENVTKALNFVRNLIKVSTRKRLTLNDFTFHYYNG